MTTPANRLRRIRKQRGFETANEAAGQFGWNKSTYKAHENGHREVSRKAAAEYAAAFKVASGWILYGEGAPDIMTTIRPIGFIGNDAALHEFSPGEKIQLVKLPPESSIKTVAAEIRGGSMRGIADTGWIVYWEDTKSPPNRTLLGKLCAIGLADGTTVFKVLQPGQTDGHYNLESPMSATILNAVVTWASQITWIQPQYSA